MSESDHWDITEFTPFGRYSNPLMHKPTAGCAKSGLSWWTFPSAARRRGLPPLLGEPSLIDRESVISKIQRFYSHVAAEIKTVKDAEEQQS